MSEELIVLLDKLQREWGEPRRGQHGEKPSAVLLRCSLALESASDAELSLVQHAPECIRQFWQYSRSAILFEDVNYGQWGLRILDPHSAIEQTARLHKDRPQDVRDGDLVFGEFLGDLDRLVIRCAPQE